MKLKLKSGEQEIEVEGSKAEIDGMLEHWWSPQHKDSAQGGLGAKKLKKAKKSAIKQKPFSSSDNDDESNFDPIVITNAIKEDPQNSAYQTHVLHKKNMYNKIALVCLHADQPLSSGEIAKTLHALDIKADQGNVSNSIKANSGRFLSTSARKKGGAVPRYKLTSHARTDFESWIAKQAQ